RDPWQRRRRRRAGLRRARPLALDLRIHDRDHRGRAPAIRAHAREHCRSRSALGRCRRSRRRDRRVHLGPVLRSGRVSGCEPVPRSHKIRFFRRADLLPLHEGLLFHRFIGGVDLFAILLIGAGGAYLWELARAEVSPRRFAAVAAATAIVFVPVLAERWSYYSDNATWMRITQA